jgi:hypothetical protein
MQKTGSHGDIREPMPGFVPGEKHDVFEVNKRTSFDKDFINYITSLNRIRIIDLNQYFKTGRRFQLVPTTGIYAGGIQGASSILFYAANQSGQAQSVSLSSLNEFQLDLSKARLLVTSKENAKVENRGQNWQLEPQTFYVWEIPLKEK